MVAPYCAPCGPGVARRASTRRSRGTGAALDKATRDSSHHVAEAGCARQAAVAAGARLPVAACNKGTYAHELVGLVMGWVGGPRAVQDELAAGGGGAASASESAKGLKPR